MRSEDPTAPEAFAVTEVGTGQATDASAGSSLTGSDGVDAGTPIGRYLVTRKLGSGAMGVVYAAYDPKLDRKVALKLLIKLDGDHTELARQRLRREAQALAKLAHPNVVGVYDVDVHAGQLYVAMEFIAGQTLGTWMREHDGPRPWRAVLDAFAEAGRGLAAAHAAGLIHRDFKPDNAMLGDDGRVRVMDFGLARPEGSAPQLEELRAHRSDALGARALELPLTHTGTVMGTPAYMAPEQFEGKADARSDQFGFCVALYEALYGQRPFSANSLGALFVALSSGEIEAPPRDTLVPGWLHAVLLRGLAPDPERRWASMDALLEALADDPAWRRRRVAGIAVVTALVAGVVGGVTWSVQRQAEACTGFEDKLAGVWDEATRSRVEQAFQLTGLAYADSSFRGAAQKLDAYTQAWVAARVETCEASQRAEQSGAALDLRMSCLDERLEHVVATTELFARADQDVVTKAVEAAAGLPPLERCADLEALTAALPAPDDPGVAARVEALDAQLVQAKALRRAGKFEQGSELAAQVVEDAAEQGYEPLQVRAWLVMGALQEQTGSYESAEATLERAYASALGLSMVPEAAEAARGLLFVVGHHQARHADALRWAKHAGPLARATGVAKAEATFANSLGTVEDGQGNYEQARAHFERALTIFEDELGPEHTQVAGALNNLGNLATKQAQYRQARAYHERALAIESEALGPDHPDLTDTLNNLSNVARAEGEHEQARAYLERALAIREQALGPDHPEVALLLGNLGNAANAQAKYAQARAYQERALAIWERALGPTHPKVAVALTNLGLALISEGEHEQARAPLERSLAIFEQALGPDHPNLTHPLGNLGIAALAQGDYEQARKYQERALAILEQAFGPDHPDVAYPLTNLGDIALAQGDYEQAAAHQARALAIFEQAQVPDELLAYPLLGRGQARLELGQPGEALADLERALSIRNALEGDPVELAATRFALARGLWAAPPEAGQDRARAQTLAELAATGYEHAGDKAADALEELRAWQTSHDL